MKGVVRRVGKAKRAHHSSRAYNMVGTARSARLCPPYKTLSLDPHATRIERRRRRPVREHRADADLPGEHVQYRQRVAVAIDRRSDRFVIEAAALVQRAVAF